MRILFATGIYPPDAGGPATYTRAMARALASQGHEVFVVAYADRARGTEQGAQSEKAFSVFSVRRSFPLPIRYAIFAWKVFRAAKNVDLVYLQGPVSEGLPGTIGAMLAGKPTVMKIVGDYAWEMYMQEPGDDTKVLLDEFVQADVGARRWRAHGKSIKIRLIEFIERWTAKRARQVIVPSNYLKKIVEQWGVPSENIEVIYNSVEPPDEGMNRDEARKSFNIEGKRVIFTAVRAVPWKNADFIISLLPELDADIIFAIAGDGPSLDFWKTEAKRLNVEDRVMFLGKLNREQMGSWYRAADLFVLPSGYEGYPNVIPEAWSQGLPCLVSDRGGNPELDITTQVIAEDTGDIVTDPIKVLSYLDREAWISRLKRLWPKRYKGMNLIEPYKKHAMVLETFKIIERVLK